MCTPNKRRSKPRRGGMFPACFPSCLRVAQHCSLFNLLPRFLQRLRIDGVERIRCKIPDPAVGVIEQGEQGGNGWARLDVKMSQSSDCSLPNLERGVDALIEPRLPGGRLILDPLQDRVFAAVCL